MTEDKAELKSISINNRAGLELCINTLGATIISLKVPDRNAKPINVVVGLESKEDYINKKYKNLNYCLGATIGRIAGRISKGQFKLNSQVYPINNINGVHLHGGKEGFDKKLWMVESIKKGDSPSVTLSYTSKHIEEGYPGNLKVFATYTLTKNNALKISYKATTDQTTIVNLTNHSYFNLNGEGSVLDHELKINSDFYLEVDENLIPSGKLIRVKGTRFDYNKKSLIKNSSFIGLDDTFVLNNDKQKAEISSRKSGIKMKVLTNQPAMVVFTPLKFQNLPFKDNAKFSEFPAICFETQHFPDSPNNEHFPSTILKPDQIYLNETIFEFSNI